MAFFAAACECVDTSMGAVCLSEACRGPQIMVHLDEVPPEGTTVRVETADTVLAQTCDRHGWCAFSYRFTLRPGGDVPQAYVPPVSATVSVTAPGGEVLTRTFELVWGTQHDHPASRTDCLEADVRMAVPPPAG